MTRMDRADVADTLMMRIVWDADRKASAYLRHLLG